MPSVPFVAPSLPPVVAAASDRAHAALRRLRMRCGFRRHFLVSVWPLSQPSPSFQLDAAALFAQATDIAQGVCLKILSAAPGGFSGTSHDPEVTAGRDARFAACVDAGAPRAALAVPVRNIRLRCRSGA